MINALVANGKLDVSAIKGKWESFISQVITAPLPGVDKALVIAGSDLRGTVFGLYDVSEQIGVSPWWWWSDVPVKSQSVSLSFIFPSLSNAGLLRELWLG